MQGRRSVNYGRYSFAIVAATAVDLVYGFVVYGMALGAEVQMYGGIYRPIEAVNQRLPWLVAGLVLTMSAAAYIYAHGYDGGGLREGLRFGAAMGLLVVGYVAIGDYVVMKVGRRLVVYLAAASFAEWALVGATIGLVYQPPAHPELAPGPPTRAA